MMHLMKKIFIKAEEISHSNKKATCLQGVFFGVGGMREWGFAAWYEPGSKDDTHTLKTINNKSSNVSNRGIQ